MLFIVRCKNYITKKIPCQTKRETKKICSFWLKIYKNCVNLKVGDSMPFILITIIILIIAILIYNFFTPKIKKQKVIKRLENYLKDSQNNYELSYSENDIFDINLKINNFNFVIKIVTIPSFSEIQINNKATWEVKYGAGNTPGKVQPHKRYLTEIINFQNIELADSIKVVIFSPKPKKIVKYINECEIIFVNSKTDVYGTRIISDNQLAFFLKYK